MGRMDKGINAAHIQGAHRTTNVMTLREAFQSRKISLFAH